MQHQTILIIHKAIPQVIAGDHLIAQFWTHLCMKTTKKYKINILHVAIIRSATQVILQMEGLITQRYKSNHFA